MHRQNTALTSLFPASMLLVAMAVGVGAQPGAEAEPLEVVAARHARGLVLQLGAGAGNETAVLATAAEGARIHLLDSAPERVTRARAAVAAAGWAARVTVELRHGPTLPFVDNLFDAVVVCSDVGIPRTELLRVVSPGDSVYTRNGAAWRREAKPWPDDIDQWTHFLHGPDNNAVADDDRVSPPRSLQWLAPPLWLRSHETPSGFQGLVSSAGRVFYFLDEGLIGITDERLPERWALICRDAFNGRLLWRKPLGDWGWPAWAKGRFAGKDWTALRAARTVVPNEAQRRIVAAGDRLFVTLAYDAPLSIVDARDGRVLHTVDTPGKVREFVVSDGIAVCALQLAGADGKTASRALAAVSGTDGRVLWTQPVGALRSLFLAVSSGRVIVQDGKALRGLALADGAPLWKTKLLDSRGRTLVLSGDTAVLLGRKTLEAYDTVSGRRLWDRATRVASGAESQDLFIADGTVWPGMLSVDGQGKLKGKAANVLAIGYDLRTGEETRRFTVSNLRSPEHHHRCYRNKATSRYVITGLEGAEFVDLQGNRHSQNNWLRGACKLGLVPANGLLYVPPDQCFCEPGAKLLGLGALSGRRPVASAAPDVRWQRGPAFTTDRELAPAATGEDWPTFRRDAARHGSSPTIVPRPVRPDWTRRIGQRLTAPIAVGDRLYVADLDTYALHALDAATGETVWTHTAAGRIDSPPTYLAGRLLVGSADGRVTCLRADNGALVWRFLAAPADRRIACMGRIESLWPVHGSVLVRDGLAYVTAGRSSYLDGGIRVYALDPFEGRVVHSTVVEGPFPDPEGEREVSFYVLGTNSDILVSEGDAVFLKSIRLTPELEKIDTPVLSTKGEMDVGLHVFSTAGLLDDSWYNRTFWMYARRWPGFQLANQAPKAGQLLVVDETTTYGLRAFYRRNVHSPMFFPGREGYLLFADHNGNEPQIVGEEGARPPVPWLPQSDYVRRGKEMRALNSPAFGLDKMIGYTRAEPPLWTAWIPVRVKAMVKAGDTLFAAGAPDVLDADDPYAAFEGRKGARLLALEAKGGTQKWDLDLAAPPVLDGLIAARGRLVAVLTDGRIVAFTGGKTE